MTNTRRSLTTETLAFVAARTLIATGDAPATAGALARSLDTPDNLGHGITPGDILWALSRLSRLGGEARHYCQRHGV